MKSPYADSTIAISIYNTLVVFGRPMRRDDLFVAVKNQHHRDLQKEQFVISLHKLTKLRLVRLVDDRFHPVDQQRRIIVGRNRNDMKERNDGHCVGGWDGWIWKSPGGALSEVFQKRGQK